MNVSELYDLTYWIDDEIVEAQIPQKYQALQAILQKNVQPNQQKQTFESERNDLITTIKRVPLNQLTKEQLIFLENLKIAQAVGDEGANKIEDILYKNVLDIATSAAKINDIIQSLNEGIQKSNQIKTGLEGCVNQEEYETENEVMIRVTFTGHASMSNVTDFKNWGSIWHEIGRGITMAHNAAPEDIKIVGATKGSIIIELATNPAIATTISVVIYSALKLAEKVLDIKKKAEEIKNLKLQNKKLANDMEKEAENEKKIGIEKIAKDLVKELKIKKDGEGDKVNALDRAVKNLVDFIETGGEVDFIIPNESYEEDNDEAEEVHKPEYNKLRDTIQEIRLLDNKLKMLESGLEEESDSE